MSEGVGGVVGVPCDIPDCMEPAKGRMTLFAEGFEGGLIQNLCLGHLFAIINVWPQIALGLAGKQA